MSARAEASSARRVTRASSRASSDGANPVGEDSIATPRPDRTKRGVTPAKKVTGKAPKVTNKPSTAYGAAGKSGYARRMSARAAFDNATRPITSAVEGAQASQEGTSGDPDRLPMLPEEEDDDESYSGLRGLPRPAVEDLPAVEPASLLDSIGNFFEGVTAWAPRLFRFGQRNNEVILDVDDPRFWQAWAEEENHRREAANDRRQRAWIFWEVVQISVLVFLLAIIADLYMGPIIPGFSIVGNRGQVSQGHNPVQTYPGANVVGRLDKFEKALQKLMSKTSPQEDAVKHQVNWFAAGNGAVVDPYLSSPTDFHCKRINKSSWYSSILSVAAKCEDVSYPQGQALRPWTEPDERWCAPPSRGKLQLTVQIARAVAPTELVLEHIPKDASLRIGDAPKEIELWVEIPNDDVHSTVSDAIGHMNPDLFADSSPQEERELDQKQALPYSFIPVGRWTYNIYQHEHIQTFHIPLNLKDYGVKATRFAIRVNSNWGNYGPTCIHRARLHGHDQSGLVEKLEEGSYTA